jgi:hypothetical protein
MFSLLLLSMLLSAPSAAAQAAVVPSDPLVVQTEPLVLVGPETPQFVVNESERSFDNIAIQPDSDICYKIRAYIFSTGPVPKLLKETTCGPKRATAKRVEGAKPKLVPIESKEKPAALPER